MKCDELKYENLGDMMPFYPRSTLVIRKQFVDAAIEELKVENKRLKEDLYKTDHHNIQYLCRMYGCDNVEAFHGEIKNLQTKLIATERALWLARAKRNRDLRTLGNFRKYVESLVRTTKRSIYHYPKQGYPANYLHKRMMDSFETWCKYLKIAEDKCLKKAEEYK